MAQVILLCGKIASGKTTYAKKLRSETGAVILSCDELMLTLFDSCLGSKHDDTVHRINDYFCHLAIQLVENGTDAILDFGYWTEHERRWTLSFFHERDIDARLYYLTADANVRKKRLERRNGLLADSPRREYIINEALLDKLEQKFEEPHDADKIIEEDITMRKKEFKDTGIMLSSLGLGCMRLPRISPDTDKIDFEQAQKLVDYAYAHGINYYDTAYVYHDGQSETFIGQALKKYPRESYYLATKMPIWHVKEEADLERIFNEQLERAGVDYFDFYLCHSIKRENYGDYQRFHTYEFLEKKRAEGKIRFIGFSFHADIELLEQVCNEHPWDFAQLQLNYLDWEKQDAKTQYEILCRHHIPCIVMEPVRGGALADLCPSANECFKKARPEQSVASWAIRYAASLDNVMVVLSGMSNLEQLTDNVGTMTDFEPLTHQDYETVNAALDAYKKKDTVPCTGCRYCMDCPQGVDIPKMFTLYNQYAVTQDIDASRDAYAKAETEQSGLCVGCGICMEHCPQHIQIPEKMKMIHSLFGGK